MFVGSCVFVFARLTYFGPRARRDDVAVFRRAGLARDCLRLLSSSYASTFPVVVGSFVCHRNQLFQKRKNRPRRSSVYVCEKKKIGVRTLLPVQLEKSSNKLQNLGKNRKIGGFFKGIARAWMKGEQKTGRGTLPPRLVPPGIDLFPCVFCRWHTGCFVCLFLLLPFILFPFSCMSCGIEKKTERTYRSCARRKY